MKSEKEVQEKIEAALQSTDGLQRAEMPPFFYTRLMAQIDKRSDKNSLQKLFGIVSRPVFTVAVLSFFVVVNMVAITSVNNRKKMPASGSNATIQGFSEEYNLSVPSIYQ